MAPMAIYLGNHSPGRREHTDLSSVFGHRIHVKIDTQEAEASVWSLWLTVGPPGPQSHPVVISLIPEGVIDVDSVVGRTTALVP